MNEKRTASNESEEEP